MSSALTTRTFWVQAIERAIKTAAQFALATFVADSAGVILFESVTWVSIPALALTGAVFSLLTSLASMAISPESTPSLVRTPPASVPAGEMPAPTPPEPPV